MGIEPTLPLPVTTSPPAIALAPSLQFITGNKQTYYAMQKASKQCTNCPLKFLLFCWLEFGLSWFCPAVTTTPPPQTKSMQDYGIHKERSAKVLVVGKAIVFRFIIEYRVETPITKRPPIAKHTF
jgi:hypothetical protein